MTGVPPKLRLGSMVPPRALQAVTGELLPVPDSRRLVHLQFRRFAGCPVCDLHLRSFAARHAEIAAAGVREIAVFHSSPEELRRYTTELPFAVVPDAGKRLYPEFGVEAGVRALLDPRVWPAMVMGVAYSLVAVLLGRQPMPPTAPNGGRFGLPADFLIAPDGEVLACRYGEHAHDQWSVGDVLTLAAGRRGSTECRIVLGNREQENEQTD